MQLPEAETLFIGKKAADLTADTFTAAAHIFAQYIKENVPKEFDRDYKAIAVTGVFLDLFKELNQI